MAFVLLLRGLPDNGKSYASKVLFERGCFDAVLHTDELYVEYVLIHRPRLYHGNLRSVILTHYLENQTEIEAAWHQYLFEVIEKDAARVPRLLVEGWQLTHCFQELDAHLTRKKHSVRHVYAASKRYIPGAAPELGVMALADWTVEQAGLDSAS